MNDNVVNIHSEIDPRNAIKAAYKRLQGNLSNIMANLEEIAIIYRNCDCPQHAEFITAMQAMFMESWSTINDFWENNG